MYGKRLGVRSSKPNPPKVNALIVALVSGRLVTATQPKHENTISAVDL